MRRSSKVLHTRQKTLYQIMGSEEEMTDQAFQEGVSGLIDRLHEELQRRETQR